VWGPQHKPLTHVAEVTDPVSHVHAKVTFTPSNAGTNVWLTLSGVEAGERCQLVVVGSDGRRDVAASWQASYLGEAKVQGMTSLSTSAVAWFEINTPDGRQLARIPVTTA